MYEWRLKYSRLRLGGSLSQEFKTLDFLANFDELHMPMLPHDESHLWHRTGHTIVLCTLAIPNAASPHRYRQELAPGQAAELYHGHSAVNR